MKKHFFFCFLVVAASVGLPCAEAANPVSLTPDKILRINFTTAPTFTDTDTLFLKLGDTEVLRPYTSMRGAMFDNNVLQGVATSGGYFGTQGGIMHFNPAVTWKTSSSLWNFYGSPAKINFTSIVNGSMQGRIDFTIQTGEMLINLDYVGLWMGHATDSSSVSPTYPNPTIISMNIIPEPATICLFSFAGLMLRRKK